MRVPALNYEVYRVNYEVYRVNYVVIDIAIVEPYYENSQKNIETL
jgi:hypothetical protein